VECRSKTPADPAGVLFLPIRNTNLRYFYYYWNPIQKNS
jgi:hypothetical protein